MAKANEQLLPSRQALFERQSGSGDGRHADTRHEEAEKDGGELTASVVGVAHVVRRSVAAVVWVGGRRVDGNVLAPIHLGQTWPSSSLRPRPYLRHQPRSFHPLYLLLGLQRPRVDSSHEVGFCADVVVSFVLDKVHAGVIRGVCSKNRPALNAWKKNPKQVNG